MHYMNLTDPTVKSILLKTTECWKQFYEQSGKFPEGTYGIDLNKKNLEGKTIEDLLRETNHPDLIESIKIIRIAQKLNEDGFDLFNLSKPNEYGTPGIFKLITISQNEKLSDEFIDMPIKRHWQLVNQQWNSSLLIPAIQWDHKVAFEKLLKTPINVNHQDKIGRTPLLFSILCKQEKYAISLLNLENINVNIRSKNGLTPLKAAIKVGSDTLVESLLLKNVTITDEDIRFAEKYATKYKSNKIVKKLNKYTKEYASCSQSHVSFVIEKINKFKI